ncbi:MAG: histidinol phosphate phosphatase domain-containing protein [Thermodesulfovibrionales bacterium]|nr:histidinol phosphate phosphatase domain-containing protein [Thermodesulfovibrionales bacterium]
MIDLHTHTIFSDGELLPFELIRRAHAAGYRAIAITDHVDASNIGHAIGGIVRAVSKIRGLVPMDIIAGAEITHAPPELIRELVKEARGLGAELVVVHGETITEPVAEGTNRAAIQAGADILAHPGLITTEDILLAKEKGVALEITSRKGHSLANGYIARAAVKFGVPIVINTDSHGPGDLITRDMASRILRAAGIEEGRIESVFETSSMLVDKALRRINA